MAFIRRAWRGNVEAKSLVGADGCGPGDGGESENEKTFSGAGLLCVVRSDARPAVKPSPESSVTDNEAHRKVFLR